MYCREHGTVSQNLSGYWTGALDREVGVQSLSGGVGGAPSCCQMSPSLSLSPNPSPNPNLSLSPSPSPNVHW